MFKIVRPKFDNVKVTQFPHCDQRILHAPGECKYCDSRYEWQQLRIAWGIAFTGYEPDENELPCPSSKLRTLAVAEKWAPNRPAPPDISCLTPPKP